MSLKILLTGATGYIGKRLLVVLVNKGYTVVCCVRDMTRFSPPEPLKKILKWLKKENSQVVSITTQLKLLAPDGRMRLADMLDYNGIIALGKEFPGKKANRF